VAAKINRKGAENPVNNGSYRLSGGAFGLCEAPKA
jgi:hypothetical protein